MINVMSSTVEVRDPYTAGHQRRATEIAVAVAREIGLPEDQVKGIQMAGRIHDIGKISIPAEILCKPGRLDDAEMQLIRRHPSIGYEILKRIDFPWPVARIVEQHHEKMDGSGYPRGLCGEEILIEARILSVADVVESISSHRPYRPSLGIQKALLEIAEHRSILYDPRAVDACLRLFQDKGFNKLLCASQNPVWPFKDSPN
jgi:putative nucleotidyltransferase with HDIG domain